MEQIMNSIKESQDDFKKLLDTAYTSGGMTKDRYVRYLSMQYHLTNGVQTHFFRLASHKDIVSKVSFRNFLIDFGIEEEPHYLIAQQDLKSLGEEVLPITLDVELWWSYFNAVIDHRPFLRLGATCILENISVESRDLIRKLFTEQDFITKRNSKFFTLHMHDDVPHGNQIIDAIKNAKLNSLQMKELHEGSLKARVMYLRMAHQAIFGEDRF